MELCVGGELLECIEGAKQGFPPSTALRSFKQIILAIEHMHSQHVAHRDVKPDNFLLSVKASLAESCLKAIDFGLSSKFQPGAEMTTYACTPLYVAPEVLSGHYTEACDVWSAGVVFFMLLCGSPPFKGRTEAEIMRSVTKGDVRFDEPAWRKVNSSIKQFVQELLEVDVDKRLSAKETLVHPCMTRTRSWVPPLSAKSGSWNSGLTQRVNNGALWLLGTPR